MSWLERLGEELAREHGAVAVILYGSRARGTERPESDVDLMLLVRGEAPARTRDARRVVTPDGHEVDCDGWIYALDQVDPRKDEGLLRIRGGRALIDPEGLVAPILASVDAVHAEGPKPFPPDELAALRVWGERMLRRVANRAGEYAAVAAYRRAELAVQLLPDLFRAHGWWYYGPEPGLRELATRAPELHAAYVAVLTSTTRDADDEAACARLVRLAFDTSGG